MSNVANKIKPHQLRKAAYYRNRLTPAESLLWKQLKKIKKYQFKCQYPLYGFIVDFYEPSTKLVIEVDGIYHYDPDQIDHDVLRATTVWEKGKCFTIRIDNGQVLKETNKVLNSILSYVDMINKQTIDNIVTK